MPETPQLALRFFTQNTALAGSDLREGLGASQGRSQGHFHSPSHLGPVLDCGRRLPRTWESGAEGQPPRRWEKRRKDLEETGCRAHPEGGVRRRTVVHRLQVKG